jgi:DNA repair exonuclease SbcCD ATPase subunit
MSRWQTEFEQHSFQEGWSNLIDEALALTVDDQTVMTAVQELGRLKRVIEYLRSVILTIDVELVPKNVWDSFEPQSNACLQQVRNFQSSRSISYLVTANQHLDNLLTYVRPYMVLPESTIKALNSVAATYRNQVEEYVDYFYKSAQVKTREIGQFRVETEDLFSHITSKSQLIETCVSELVVGTVDAPSAREKIYATKEAIDDQQIEIENFYSKLLVDNEKSQSIKSKVTEVHKQINEDYEQMTILLNSASQQLNNLEKFHQKIYGLESDDGKANKGLKQELEERVTALTQFESDQLSKYNALYAEIESLLSGATNVGLAKSYEGLRRSFSDPIKKNTYLFYAAIALMPVVAFIASIEHFSILPFVLNIAFPSSGEAIFKSMVLKIPFIAPLVWLAIFASTRRSQYERLQQEYAHKAAFAKSYESYKKQLSALKVTETQPLQTELITKAIAAISFNASTTLDGKNKDKMPMEYAFEKLGGEQIVKLIEQLKKLIPGK